MIWEHRTKNHNTRIRVWFGVVTTAYGDCPMRVRQDLILFGFKLPVYRGIA